MFVVNSYSLAVIFCFITMLCWGSWGNTQKLAGKTWRYELFYWDYVIGMVLFAILMINTTALTGAIMQMLSHGLMTALFFALIGMIYGRTHTRDIRELSGLMKVMPFLAVGYVIAGLANLGLPGLSGFVAEMTIFNGAFMNNDTFHRVVTIIACTSIVITAVYILRVIGRILYGTCRNEAHLKLTDATWDERLTVICLIAAIAGMGTMPLWISDMVSGSVSTIISQLMN